MPSIIQETSSQSSDLPGSPIESNLAQTTTEINKDNPPMVDSNTNTATPAASPDQPPMEFHPTCPPISDKVIEDIENNFSKLTTTTQDAIEKLFHNMTHLKLTESTTHPSVEINYAAIVEQIKLYTRKRYNRFEVDANGNYSNINPMVIPSHQVVNIILNNKLPCLNDSPEHWFKLVELTTFGLWSILEKTSAGEIRLSKNYGPELNHFYERKIETLIINLFATIDFLITELLAERLNFKALYIDMDARGGSYCSTFELLDYVKNVKWPATNVPTC